MYRAYVTGVIARSFYRVVTGDIGGHSCPRAPLHLVIGVRSVSTMREVAALAGVSAKTVSRVLRHDRYVSEEVRLRVERAVAELQYVPNALARTFRSGSDNA